MPHKSDHSAYIKICVPEETDSAETAPVVGRRMEEGRRGEEGREGKRFTFNRIS
jgi:hypothetical protein